MRLKKYAPSCPFIQSKSKNLLIAILISLVYFRNNPLLLAQEKSTDETANIVAQQRLALYESLSDSLFEFRFISRQKQIEVKPTSNQIEFVPALFTKIKDSKVVKKEAYEGYQKPIYTTIDHQVLTKDAYQTASIKAPIFENYSDEIKIRPAQNILVKNKNVADCSEKTTSTVECYWTKIEQPQVSKTIPRNKLVTESQVEFQDIAPEYITIKKQVIDWEKTQQQAKGTRLIKVKPIFQTVEKELIRKRSRLKKIPVAAETIAINVEVWADTNED